MKYALVTGSSQGIGLAIAQELASKGHPILLIALDQPILKEAAEQISITYGVATDYLGIDLTEADAAQRVFMWVEENGYQVQILVNNAGYGRGGDFNHFPLSTYHHMMDLNNKALLSMTYAFRPHLAQQGDTHILLVSSMEASLPLPYKPVYSGTKWFIFGFGQSLRTELKDDDINVSILCPGPTITNESGLERLKDAKAGQLIAKMPDAVAKSAIRGMLKKKSVIVPGRLQAFLFYFSKLIPYAWKMPLMKKMTAKFKKNPA